MTVGRLQMYEKSLRDNMRGHESMRYGVDNGGVDVVWAAVVCSRRGIAWWDPAFVSRGVARGSRLFWLRERWQVETRPTLEVSFNTAIARILYLLASAFVKLTEFERSCILSLSSSCN